MRLILVALVTPGLLAAQAVTQLTKPDLEFAPELTSITGVHELSDGRVILLDRKEKKILVLDQKGGATPVGREGSGPGEYLNPSALVALPGDSTLIEDGLNRRYLVIDRSGKAVGTLPLIAFHPQDNVTYTVTPRGSDTEGRLYVLTPTGLVTGDRIHILRFSRDRSKFDTVGSIRNERFGAARQQPTARSGGASFGFTAAKPWTIKDEWVVMPDGWLAVAHNEPYSVDWISPASVMTKGALVPFSPVKVTEAERERWRAQQLENAGTLTTTANGKTTVRKVPVPEPDEWPETLPAFSGAASVVASPRGTVWIQRLGAASVKATTYDVIDRAGRVVERVELPRDHRVIGFGKTFVYVVRTDDDGLQHLQRYRR